MMVFKSFIPKISSAKISILIFKKDSDMLILCFKWD